MSSAGSINIHSPLARPCAPSIRHNRSLEPHVLATRRRITLCCAAQEPTAVALVNDKEVVTKKSAEPAQAAPPPAKPKKAPAKPLPQMMEEDVIPALKTTLEAQDDLLQIQLSFNDNRLEGSFLKKDIPYYFWAFFPDGVLTGPKGFSLSSYGSGASTVEPFLIDERKITDKLVVFWIEKRLAAQGILPVWK